MVTGRNAKFQNWIQIYLKSYLKLIISDKIEFNTGRINEAWNFMKIYWTLEYLISDFLTIVEAQKFVDFRHFWLWISIDIIKRREFPKV